MSRFSKNDPEFFACLNISLHLNSIASRFRVSSFFVVFFAIVSIVYLFSLSFLRIILFVYLRAFNRCKVSENI